MLLILYTDGLIESNHNVDEGEARLLWAARAAVEAQAANPAQYIVESVLHEHVSHPDDVAVMTISFD